MKNIGLLTMITSVVTAVSSCAGGDAPVYLDASAPAAKRVEDLLSRMTLEEKVGQMNQFVGLEHIRKNEASLSEEDLKNNTANAFYPGFNADLDAAGAGRFFPACADRRRG